jgi:hypothetical protein
MRPQLLLLIPTALSYAATFNFDHLPLPTVTPFSDTNAGITASFTTPDPFRCFFLSSNNYEPAVFSGNILYDCHIGNSELDIAFSKNLSSVSLLFETLANSPVTFTLSAFSGGINGMQVGTIDALGTASATSFNLWSGPISFSGPPFDSIKLTSAAGDWAIDQINVVGIADAPEPATLVLAGLTFILGTLTTRIPARL